MEPIDIYTLPCARNVCNQVSREVFQFPKISIAHVTVNPGEASNWHYHNTTTEIYFILEGEGILYESAMLQEPEKAWIADRNTLRVIHPSTAHKLKNTGTTTLEHLVFALPPFNPDDVQMLKDTDIELKPQRLVCPSNPMTALDGILAYDLLSDEDSKRLDISLAVGILPARRKTHHHHHSRLDQVYFVTQGQGKMLLGQDIYEVKKDNLMMIPKNTGHNLENTTQDELFILRLSSPRYQESEFQYSG